MVNIVLVTLVDTMQRMLLLYFSGDTEEYSQKSINRPIINAKNKNKFLITSNYLISGVDRVLPGGLNLYEMKIRGRHYK